MPGPARILCGHGSPVHPGEIIKEDFLPPAWERVARIVPVKPVEEVQA